MLLISSVHAQYGNVNCPGDSADCTEWEPTIMNKRVQLSFEHDQYAFVTYKFRYCNGVLEIFIEGIEVVDNAGHLREFNIQHYDFATLRSVIELGLITEHERTLRINNGVDSLPAYNPLDPLTFTCQDTVSWVNFYSATCGIFLRCEYRRVNWSKRDCDSGYDSSWYPEYIRFGDDRIVFIDKWQPCGTNCCKRTYKICRTMSENPSVAGVTFNPIPILKIVSTNIESISWCTEQHKYNKTCYTNCWNTP